MEQKPHKKEELMIANSVLKLAENLIKVSNSCGCWQASCLRQLVSTSLYAFGTHLKTELFWRAFDMTFHDPLVLEIT